MSEKRKIGPYELVEQIGEGGFGLVYIARHDTLKREVALKIILPLYANQEEFITRFEVEAQLVARLEHQHIVTLYNFWRDPEGAYLAMQLIRGGNLGDAILQSNLKGEFWGLERATTLLNQIASALHAAHRNNVVHQDIKPGNILLNESGDAFLTDFGIARDLDSGINLAKDDNNVMHGSPKYISPEHLKRQDITPQSDIYSLGILMFEVLTGEPPYDSTELLELLQMHLRRQIPPLEEYRPDLPPELTDVLRKATTRKLSERYESVLDFANDFDDAVYKFIHGSAAPIGVTSAREVDGSDIPNPYKGLAAFQEADVNDFFGREELTKKLLRRIIEQNVPYHRLLAVVGPSGSGKSSVVRAGVIPQIRAGAIAGVSFYTATMIPGTNPMRGLEGAVLRVAARADDAFLNKLSQPKFDLREVLELSMPDTGEMLLIIDQFEEVFTLVEDPDIRTHFLTTLYEAITHPDSRLRMIITMRADFTGRALQEQHWGQIIQERAALIPTMSAEELKAAIVKPAERVGLVLQSGLTDLIISDVQREVGSLPLLQYTLGELYEEREGVELTLEAYNRLGGITGALAKRAEDTYTALPESQKQIAQRIFPRLVKLGEGSEDTRRREFLTNLYTLHPDNAGIDAVLAAFQNGHLIARTYHETNQDIVVEVAHETLIRRWPRLRQWLDDNRDALRLQESLTAEVAQWVESGRSSDFLARGDRLVNFAELLVNDAILLSADERAFLVASDEAAQAAVRRRQLVITTISIFAVVSFISAIIAGVFWRSSVASEQTALEQRDIANVQSTLAVEQRDVANAQSTLAYENEQEAISERDRANEQSILARARELAAFALVYADTQHDRATLLSLEAIETSRTYETQNSLLTALQSDPLLLSYLNGHTDFVRAVKLNPDKTILATASRNGELFIWDIVNRQRINELDGHEGRISNVVFNTDGSLMASVGFDGQLIIWDTSTWQQSQSLTWADMVDSQSVPNGWGLSFSPDNSTVAVGDNLGNVILWDIATGEPLEVIQAHSNAVYSLAYHPDGTMFATGGGDNMVRLWDATSYERIAEFEEHENWILDLAFNPTGQFVVSADADGILRFWSTSTLEGLGGLTGHNNGVRTILFADDGQLLISADVDGVIIVNDLADRNNTFSITSPEDTAVWSIDLLGNSLIVAGETDSVFLVSLNNQPAFPFNRRIGTTTDVINRVAFSTDSTLLAAAGGSDANFDISVWDVATGDEQRIDSHQNVVNDLVWSDNRLMSVDFDGLVNIWEDGVSRSFTVDEPVLSVAAHGNLVALGDSNGNVDVWNIEAEPEHIETLPAHSNVVFALAFSPDGRQLVTASRDETLTLWNMESYTQVGDAWVGHSDDVLAVAFSPDGQYVASGSRDDTVRIWDVTTGQPASAPLAGHSNWVTGLAFSADGNLLVTGSTDNTVRLWDLETMRQLGQALTGHTASINSIDISSDGRLIASGGVSGNVLLWNADLSDWIATACEFANRTLTAAEVQEFFSDDFPPVGVCSQQT